MSTFEPRLQHAEVEVEMAAAPQQVWDGIIAIAASLWGVEDDDVVTATPPTFLVHAVRLDEQVSCWLTWSVVPGDSGGSLVRLVHDEPDLRPSPAPELGEVMAVLNRHLSSGDGDLPPQRRKDGEAAHDA